MPKKSKNPKPYQNASVSLGDKGTDVVKAVHLAYNLEKKKRGEPAYPYSQFIRNCVIKVMQTEYGFLNNQHKLIQPTYENSVKELGDSFEPETEEKEKPSVAKKSVTLAIDKDKEGSYIVSSDIPAEAATKLSWKFYKRKNYWWTPLPSASQTRLQLLEQVKQVCPTDITIDESLLNEIKDSHALLAAAG